MRDRYDRLRASSHVAGEYGGLSARRAFPPTDLGAPLIGAESCQIVPFRPPLKLAKEVHSSALWEVVQTSIIARNRLGPTVRAMGCLPLYRVVAHGQVFTPIPGRGGARNRADRLTTTVSGRDAGKLRDAVERTFHSGLPFNRFTTVHWEAAGVADDLKATARLLKLITDWLRSRGRSAAFLWVRENGHRKGRHVHILLHLPPDLLRDFNRRQRKWLAACGARWRRGVLKSEPIGRSYEQALCGGPDYGANLDRVVDYVLKGADRQTRERFGIERSENGGAVVGKRCGVSQSLGPSGCRAAQKLQVTAKDFGKSGAADHGRE